MLGAIFRGFLWLDVTVHCVSFQFCPFARVFLAQIWRKAGLRSNARGGRRGFHSSHDSFSGTAGSDIWAVEWVGASRHLWTWILSMESLNYKTSTKFIILGDSYTSYTPAREIIGLMPPKGAIKPMSPRLHMIHPASDNVIWLLLRDLKPVRTKHKRASQILGPIFCIQIFLGLPSTWAAVDWVVLPLSPPFPLLKSAEQCLPSAYRVTLLSGAWLHTDRLQTT